MTYYKVSWGQSSTWAMPLGYALVQWLMLVATGKKPHFATVYTETCPKCGRHTYNHRPCEQCAFEARIAALPPLPVIKPSDTYTVTIKIYPDGTLAL